MPRRGHPHANIIPHEVAEAASGMSPRQIKDAILNLGQRLRTSNWLSGNQYNVRDTRRIENDIHNNRVNQWDLTEYMAASVPIHALDGWAYLARSVHALLSGDPGGAIHSAYYAELRATIAFLASQGFGIFNASHIWFDDQGGYTRIPRSVGLRTHKAAWQVLEEWSRNPQRSKEIFDLLRVRSHTLTTWINGVATAGTASAAAERWLQSWSLDLRQLAKDREGRNKVSYSPQRLPPCTLSNSYDEIQTVKNYWEILEPIESNKFELLDRHLLAQALALAYKGVHKVEGNKFVHSVKFETFVEEAIRQVVGSADPHLKASLINHARNPHPLFVNAKRRTSEDPKAVIARAILLLRLASGAACKLLLRVGLAESDLSDWWHPEGQNCGLWDGTYSQPLIDLWADIDVALSAFENCAPTSSRKTIRDQLGGESYIILQQFERVGLWGTTP